MEYVDTKAQATDIFTKAHKWGAALDLWGDISNSTLAREKPGLCEGDA